jgi:tetratricopeptide (TPR) repeat protein
MNGMPRNLGRLSLALLLALSACSDAAAIAHEQADPAATAADTTSRSEAAGPVDAPIAPFQTELLQIAFDTATAMPVKPHIKSRSRAQELVVGACLELEQLARAATYLEKIENWRRGTAAADLAIHCVQKGERGEFVERFLERAYIEAEAPDEEIGQGWRRERIKAKLAQAYSLLGRRPESMMFRGELENTEAARVAVFEAGFATEEQFNALIATLDQAVQIGDFSMIQYALEATKSLYSRFFADAERRKRIEERAEHYWRTAPFGLRIDVLLSFAEAAKEAGEREYALGLLAKTAEQVGASRWTALDYAPVMGRMAESYREVGAAEKAIECLRSAQQMYEAEREKIWNFERSTALRPIAEAQTRLGDRSGALATYRRAIEEGAENPNARPRAEDLAATCCSMARVGLEPDAELLARIREIRSGLADPW